MEIIIDDIPEEGLEVEASQADSWLKDAVRDSMGDDFAEGDQATVSVQISRVERNVSIDGTIEIKFHPSCDRCLMEYEEDERIPFHAVLAPLYESKRQEEMEQGMEVELVKEDMEFGFYEGDRFDLDDVIREQIVLAQPMKHLCREECAGLCQRCGKDLNSGPCGCPMPERKSSFSALSGVRVGKGSRPRRKRTGPGGR